MSTSTPPTGPGPEEITRAILDRHPETVIAEALGATFFSLDEKHWPNYATIVTTDEHDEGAPSNLARPGAFRLNIGVGRETFHRVVGTVESPDYAAYDQLLPHPVYARQRWISILNPSHATFREVVLPLIDEAHDRLAARRARPQPNAPVPLGQAEAGLDLRAFADHLARILFELEALVGRLADETVRGPAGELGPDHELRSEPLGITRGGTWRRNRER